MNARKVALVMAACLLAAMAQAQTYKKVAGTNVDFYFDASQFDNEVVHASGDSLVISSSRTTIINDYTAAGAFIVVPHAGYLLSSSTQGVVSGLMSYQVGGNGDTMFVDYTVSSHIAINAGTYNAGTFTTTQTDVAASQQGSHAQRSKPYGGSLGLTPVGSNAVADVRTQDLSNYAYNNHPGFFSDALYVDTSAILSGSGLLATKLDVSFAFSTAAVSAVPESDSYAMLGAGLGLLGVLARRRKSGRTRTGQASAA